MSAHLLNFKGLLLFESKALGSFLAPLEHTVDQFINATVK